MAIDTIKSTAVLDGAIATADIADDAVTTDKLANAINTDIAAKAPTASPAFTGNVGIGTTPASKLHILDSTDGGASLSTAIQIGRRGGTGDNAYLQTLHSGSDAVSALTFKIGSTERLRIQSGDGISFNGDTAAANALNDYEEGTWTPIIRGNTPAPTGQSYARQNGRYTKVGRLVTLEFDVVLSAKGTVGGSYLIISGIPFNPDIVGRSGTTGVYFESMGTSCTSVVAVVNRNDQIFIWVTTAAQASLTRTNPATDYLTNDTGLTGSVTFSTS